MDVPHSTLLSFVSPLALSVVCLWSGGVWLMLWSRQRERYMLVSALFWLGLCGYFAIGAVSAGAHPIVTRGDIAEPLRAWGLFVAALIVAGKMLLLRALWRNGQAARAAAGDEESPPG